MKIFFTAKKTIDFDSQLPSGMSGEKLKELERGPVSQAPAPEAPRQPPHFITQIQSATVDEGEPVRFECRVEPKEDPNLRIEWYRNGKVIPAGHRYRSVYDMGFVSMDILYVYPEDSGEYVCKAVNDLGEDTTRAAVSCKSMLFLSCYFLNSILLIEISQNKFVFYRIAEHYSAKSSTKGYEKIWSTNANGSDN